MTAWLSLTWRQLMAAGCQDDVERGWHMLQRFGTLSQAVASIRLGAFSTPPHPGHGLQHRAHLSQHSPF